MTSPSPRPSPPDRALCNSYISIGPLSLQGCISPMSDHKTVQTVDGGVWGRCVARASLARFGDMPCLSKRSALRSTWLVPCWRVAPSVPRIATMTQRQMCPNAERVQQPVPQPAHFRTTSPCGASTFGHFRQKMTTTRGISVHFFKLLMRPEPSANTPIEDETHTEV